MALRPITLITGASSGIGRELARVFARNGHDVALVARRKDRLEALATELEAAYAGRGRIVIVADLENRRGFRSLPMRSVPPVPSRNISSTMPALVCSAVPMRAIARRSLR